MLITLGYLALGLVAFVQAPNDLRARLLFGFTAAVARCGATPAPTGGSWTVSEGRVDIPLLSVIVTAYNIEDFLEECLRTLVGQTLTDMEIIVVDDGCPVFFRQDRAGRDGRPFRIWKFRSMVRNADELLVDGSIDMSDLSYPWTEPYYYERTGDGFLLLDPRR